MIAFAPEARAHMRDSVSNYLGIKPQPRRDLSDIKAQSVPQRRNLIARYDAAQDSTEFKNYWAAADQLDADSANSREVRAKLVARSRYEAGNNGFVDGILKTYANDLVGIGPKLRMQTGSTGFNQLVEAEWYRWSKAVNLRRKLWCMAHAKVQDGEAIAVIRRNPRVKHPIKLDVVLYETEQCQSPWIPLDLIGEKGGYVDGIRFDEFGNPAFYDLLNRHPGSQTGYGSLASHSFETERIPAEFVLHWYSLIRPGQHRGIPDLTSTLNVGASSRRFREAVVAAAETAADHTVILQTTMAPDQIDEVAPLSTLDINKRMMTAVPQGWGMTQMDAKHPTSTYDTFVRSQINESARPLNMPYNKAACDSSSYNYASGRLDHQTYYGGLDVDREDGNDLALDVVFAQWFRLAILYFGWLGGNPDSLGPAASAHAWDWPKHPVADVSTEATSNETKLKTGQLSLTRLYTMSGEDFEDEVVVMANDYGVTVDEMRRQLFVAMFNDKNQQASMEQAAAQQKQADNAAKQASETVAAQRDFYREFNAFMAGGGFR